jgi:hypothetical protein
VGRVMCSGWRGRPPALESAGSNRGESDAGPPLHEDIEVICSALAPAVKGKGQVIFIVAAWLSIVLVLVGKPRTVRCLGYPPPQRTSAVCLWLIAVYERAACDHPRCCRARQTHSRSPSSLLAHTATQSRTCTPQHNAGHPLVHSNETQTQP